MDRFGKLGLQIRNLNLEVALHHMVTTLKPGPFVDSLCMEPTRNMDEMRIRVAKFMQLEELREFRGQGKVKNFPK